MTLLRMLSLEQAPRKLKVRARIEKAVIRIPIQVTMIPMERLTQLMESILEQQAKSKILKTLLENLLTRNRSLILLQRKGRMAISQTSITTITQMMITSQEITLSTSSTSIRTMKIPTRSLLQILESNCDSNLAEQGRIQPFTKRNQLRFLMKRTTLSEDIRILTLMSLICLSNPRSPLPQRMCSSL